MENNEIRYKGGIYTGDLNEEGKPNGYGTLTFSNSMKLTGFFNNGKKNGGFILKDPSGQITRQYYKDDKPLQTKEELIDREDTKEPLYTEIIDNTDDDKIKEFGYIYKKENEEYILYIDYDKINRNLNRNEIREINDIIKTGCVVIYDQKNTKIITDEELLNFDIIGECAKYQMKTRLENKEGELDDSNKMTGGNTGLENLLILAGLEPENIDALKRIRFEIQQADDDWPRKIYTDPESLLNSYGLTINNPSGDPDNLVSIYDLDIDYISSAVLTTTNNHAINITLDLEKIKNNDQEKFIYCYDTFRSTDSLFKAFFGNLGNLTKNCDFFSHFQQIIGSCWYESVCAALTATKHPELIEKIRTDKIRPVSLAETLLTFLKTNVKLNDFELLQVLETQFLAEKLGFGRIGKKTKGKIDRPKIINQNVNQPFKNKIKRNFRKNNKAELNEYFKDIENQAKEYNKKFKNLEQSIARIGTFLTLLIICKSRGLEVKNLEFIIKREFQRKCFPEKQMQTQETQALSCY